MRIRGYDEETEEYSEDIAVLTGKIADFTKTASKPGGVTLFTDETKETYRSTYEILSDIADIWDELSDVNQARLLENLFGKRQSQVGAAILSNFEQARAAIDAMANSAGGAEREFELVANSLEARLNALRETWTGVAQNLFQTDGMKGAIAVLQGLSDFVAIVTDKLGLFGTALASISIGTFISKFNSLKSAGEVATAFEKVLGVSQKFYKSAELTSAQITALKTALRGMDEEAVKSFVSTRQLGVYQAAAALSTTNLTAAETAATLAMKGFNAEQIKSAMLAAGYDAQMVKDALAADTFAAAQTHATGATIGLTNALKGFFATPLGWITAAAAAIYGLVKVVDALTVSFDEAVEKAEESKRAYEESQSNVDSLNSKLETTAQRIDELNKKGTLTVVEQEELDRLQAYNDKLQDQLDIEMLIAQYRQSEAIQDAKNAVENKGFTAYSDGSVEKNNFWNFLARMGAVQNGDMIQSADIIDYAAAKQQRLNTLTEERNRLLEEQAESVRNGTATQNDLDEYKKKIEYIEGQLPKLRGEIGEALDEINEWYDTLTDDATGKAYQGVENVVERIEYLYNLVENSAPDTINIGVSTPDTATNQSAKQMGAQESQLRDLKDAVNELEDAYELLDQAQSDMDTDGGLSPDTILKLAAAEENYLDYLYEENGVIKLNTEAWRENAKAKMQADMGEIQGKISALNSEREQLEKSIPLWEEQSASVGDNQDALNGLQKKIRDGKVRIGEISAEITENQKRLSLYSGIFDQLTNDSDKVQSAFDPEPVNKFKESLSVLKGAFDDLGKDGSVGVAYSTIASIQEKFGDVAGIDTFISRLLDAGTNAEKVSGVLGDLVMAKLDAMDASESLANTDERLIKAMLDEVGVANSDKVAHEILAKAKRQVEINSRLEKDGILSVISSLDSETAYTIEAKNETILLAAKFLDLNRTKLDLSQQKAELLAIAQAAGVDIALLNAVKGAANTGSNYTAADFDMNARDPFGNPIDAAKPSNVINAGASWESIYDSVMRQINERINASARSTISFKPSGDSGSSGGSGGGSSVEKYIADIDEFYEALKRVEAVEQRIATLQSRIDTSEDVDERIDLTKQLINSYKEEAAAMEDLNRQRSDGIQSAINDLEQLGFVITYNAETHELLIRNMEHLNELEAGSTEATNELRKETEELIKDLESWNDANQQTEASLRGITSNIREARDAMVEYLEEAVSRANEMVDGLQNVYQTLADAAKEYAETGYLSVDSLQSILELGPKYMAMLVDENGQLVLNEESLQKVIAARTEEMAAETALSYAKQILLATETGEIETLQQLTQVDIAASNATWDMAYATLGLARAIGTANGVQESYYDDAFEYIKKMQSLTKTAVNSISAYYETLNDDYISQKDGLDQILQLTQDMIKWENDQQIKALEDEKDVYADIIDQKKELIQLAKEQADRERSVQDKLAEIAKLQAKIAQLSLDDSREAQAQKSKLEEELAELQKSLADEQAGYSTDSQINALDKQLEAYNLEKDKEIEGLQDMLGSAEKLYQAAIARIEGGWDSLYQDLLDWNYNYGNTLQKDLVNAWDAASAAVQRYGGFVQALDGTASHTGLGGYDNSPPGSDSYMNAAATQQTNESIARSIVSQMKANSARWADSDDSGRNALAAENERLGAELGQLLGANVYRDQNGVWWIDGKRLYDVYHKGGIVGGGSYREDERLALLKDKEWVLNEQMVDNLSRQIENIGKLKAAFNTIPDYISKTSMGDSFMTGGVARSVTNNSNNGISIVVPVQVIPTQKLDEADIQRFSQRIGAISADYIREGFTKRGVRQNASLF